MPPFNTTNIVGNPSNAPRYKQPPGTTLFKYTYEGSRFGFMYPIQEDPNFGNRSVVKVPDYDGQARYTASDTIFLLDRLYMKFASSSWDSPGSDPRLNVAKSFPRASFSGDDSNSNSVIESPDCDNPEITEVSMAPAIHYYEYGAGSAVPIVKLDADFLDLPVSMVGCIDKCVIICRMLLPNDAILDYHKPSFSGEMSLEVNRVEL